MWYFIAIVCIFWIGFLVWAKIEDRRRLKKQNKEEMKPPFRSEEDLEEYGKPMEDYHPPTVDFDDEE